jgi:hypothetical protein
MRRLARTTLWVKALPLLLVVVFGLSERSAAFIVLPLVTVFIWATIKHGLREQYREPFRQQIRRHWDDLVWDNSRWLNHRGSRLETPSEGIERLAGPWKEVHDATRVRATPGGELRALVGEARVHAQRRHRRKLPSAPRAPHELAIR